MKPGRELDARNAPRMNALLTSWASLEPDRCAKKPAGWSVVGQGAIIAEFRADDFDCCAEGETLARIQAAVQDAVDHRGWFWEVSRPFSRRRSDLPYLAQIDWNLDPFGSAVGATAAEALLAAHLQALAIRPTEES